jgi:Glycosyl hydrolase family 76
MSRRVLAGPAALLCALVVLVTPGRLHATTDAASVATADAARARIAYAAMQRFFHRPGNALYRNVPGTRGYAPAWPFSQAFAATVAVAGLPGAGRSDRAAIGDRLRGLSRYWDGTGYRPRPRIHGDRGGPRYSDDNEWIALELTNAGRLGVWRGAIPRARRIFDLALRHWDRDRTHPCAGGIFWTDRPDVDDRNTVSTAPAAELALQLYLFTKQPRFLYWGHRFYHWVETCMARDDGLFADHLDLRGNRDWTVWSYNQGTMIGASVMLARATGQQHYLERAEQLANVAMTYYSPGRLIAEPTAFGAIFVHNLLALEQLDPDPGLRSRLQAYADALWSRVDPATGLLHISPKRRPRLIEQAALVRVLATLAGGCLTPCM